MIERKIYKKIEEFYEQQTGRALMVTGARQVGKTYIIEHFAKQHFPSYIKLDFIEHPEYISLFSGVLSAEDIEMRLSALYGDRMVAGETFVFFDEVQECPEIITQIKYLVQSGKYTYILSGSLLGVIFQKIRSVPVGYLSTIAMFPMDFEEFAMANGVSASVFDALRSCFDEKKPVDSFLHQRLITLFELYLMVGGMPAAVDAYLTTKNLAVVQARQTDILNLYRDDIAKYDEEDKLHIQDVFDLIPSELNTQNKRFVLKNLNEYTKFSKYDKSFLWLKNAGVALPVYTAKEPVVPLVLSKATSLFKLFLNDVGLLASVYGQGLQLKILNHETDINFGAIYENAVAQELFAHGFRLYYYNNKKMGEIDFCVEKDGEIHLIEVKSGKDYHRHSAVDNLLRIEQYDIRHAYVFCNGNVETKERITYYPVYMISFLVRQEDTGDMIYDTDFSDVNLLV